MYSLLLSEKLAISATPNRITEFTGIARGWRRATRAVGGYWLGSFFLSGQEVNREEMIYWFNNYLGNHLEEQSFGLTSWEGLLYEMTLTLDGIQYRRTMDREWWHNYVKVLYRDIGVQSGTAWGQDADSIGEYGRMEYLDTIGEATSAEATGLRDMRLEDFAFPRSRMVGSLEFGSQPKQGIDTLQITAAGYVITLNWRYRTTSIAATAANTAISTLVGTSEFVTAGTIASNALSVDVDCTTPQRLWDAIEGIIDDGDASGNRWVGGVYEDREFDYNAAATEVEYWLRDGLLVNKGGSRVVPTLLKPDFIIRNSAAPSGLTPLGGNVWDDPRNAWITEVEFVAPDGLILKPAGFEDVDVLKEQLR